MQIFALPLTPIAFIFSCVGLVLSTFGMLMPNDAAGWGSLISAVAGLLTVLLAIFKFAYRQWKARKENDDEAE